MRGRLALSVLEDIRTSAPHAINGLSKTEVDARIEIAIGKAARYYLDTPEDFKAFVRLCFVVGPNFDEYPRFHEILTGAVPGTGLPIMELFYLAEEEDWPKAAQFDIVSRYREPVLIGRPSQERQQQPESVEGYHVSLTPLQNRHAESYFLHALHPDVWRLARMKPLTTLDDVQQLILEQERKHTAGYAIVGSREEFLGAIFVSLAEAASRISYWIGRPMWGKGIATEALKELTGNLRQEKGAPIRLRVDPGNIPSIKVAEKCGFTRTNHSSRVRLIFEA